MSNIRLGIIIILAIISLILTVYTIYSHGVVAGGGIFISFACILKFIISSETSEIFCRTEFHAFYLGIVIAMAGVIFHSPIMKQGYASDYSSLSNIFLDMLASPELCDSDTAIHYPEIREMIQTGFEACTLKPAKDILKFSTDMMAAEITGGSPVLGLMSKLQRKPQPEDTCIAIYKKLRPICPYAFALYEK